MRSRHLDQILILVLVVFIGLTAGIANCSAQDVPASETKVAAAEPLGENEPLPFMQSDQNTGQQEVSSAGLLMKTLGALLLIVGLIFFGAWGAKKLGFGNDSSNEGEANLAIVASIGLGNGRTISTVRFGERILLVGSTPQSFTLLAEETPSEIPILKNSRSVAEMLAEEAGLFDTEFENAQVRLDAWDRGSGPA